MVMTLIIVINIIIEIPLKFQQIPSSSTSENSQVAQPGETLDTTWLDNLSRGANLIKIVALTVKLSYNPIDKTTQNMIYTVFSVVIGYDQLGFRSARQQQVWDQNIYK